MSNGVGMIVAAVTDMTQAELDEALAEAQKICREDKYYWAHETVCTLARAVLHLADSLKLQRECCAAYEFELSELRAEVARLAARQMPVLRWEKSSSGENCFLGGIFVGSAWYTPIQVMAKEPWRAWVMVGDDEGSEIGWFVTQSEAMACVEVSVRKEMGAPPPHIEVQIAVSPEAIDECLAANLDSNATAHPPGDLQAIVAKLQAQLAKIIANQCGACRAYDRLGL